MKITYTLDQEEIFEIIRQHFTQDGHDVQNIDMQVSYGSSDYWETDPIVEIVVEV